MLLVSFALLSVFSVGVWLLGAYFEYAGIAAIGATLLIATGGAVTLTDLEVQTGQTVEKSYTTLDNNTTVVNETETTPQYDTISIIDRFGGSAGHLGFGGLVMVIGGLLFAHTMNEVG